MHATKCQGWTMTLPQNILLASTCSMNCQRKLNIAINLSNRRQKSRRGRPEFHLGNTLRGGNTGCKGLQECDAPYPRSVNMVRLPAQPVDPGEPEGLI